MSDNEIESQPLTPSPVPATTTSTNASTKGGANGGVRLPSRTMIALLAIALLGLFVGVNIVLESEMSFACFQAPQPVLPLTDAPVDTNTLTVHDVRFSTKDDESPAVLAPGMIVDNKHNCTPSVIDPNAIDYHSDHRFYKLLQGIGPLPPPVFRGQHMELCDLSNHKTAKYDFCLPIAGRKDEPYCNAPDRMDLLVRHTPKTMCYGSALHMLLIDVYDEFKAAKAAPILLYGTLLGAIRNSSTIPFTEDSDVGYVKRTEEELDDLKLRLWHKGYHMFFQNIWRVCIAPTHPLASNMYDPNHTGLSEDYLVPYVDLYEMHKHGDTEDWFVDCAKDDRIIPADKFEPYHQVHMNGLAFDSVADPIDFLIAEYGEDYMVPKPRGRRRRRV
ncbi:TPA: hypothetical protein N0F65_007242 [Lagenidium giganteum]|uniref:Uncharacterized protein n=1 Tax=Lagenidium giganteum TaxID=4803 RepID=A0AAV2YL00_9STRA|nr:TPA: hypothetical protein N0F65_007242 [Lagenidium giganteum]